MTAYDPARDGFDNARLMMVAADIGVMVSKKVSELAYGAWNPQFCSADAAQDAALFFSDLRAKIDFYAHQADKAVQAPPRCGESLKVDGMLERLG